MRVATTRKEELRRSLETVRERTLWLLSQVPEEFLKRRVHEFYSPIGWHFGHVGRTEEYWVVSKAFQKPVLDDHLSFLFADLPDNPKDNRVHMPDREEVINYLQRTRASVLACLEEADLESDNPYFKEGYAWDFAIQHECQHQETIAEMLALIHKQQPEEPNFDWPVWATSLKPEFIAVPGGTFQMGSDALCGYDNEKAAHPATVESFQLAKHPVTAYEWSQFIADQGYERLELWTTEGWEWRQQENATMPEYWVEHDGHYAMIGSQGLRPIHPDEPANCLSWYEADAYCRWSGLRMPTEAEWEYAACHKPTTNQSRTFPWGNDLANGAQAQFGQKHWNPGQVGQHPAGASPNGIEDMAGGVWEWTSTPFLPYPNFEAFPYDGYSKDHMKGLHKVCRGGSWATAAPILRCSFRNWYVPTYRQGFLGLRCAR